MMLTNLQRNILRGFSDRPISGWDLMQAIGYAGHNRSFANAMIRMMDKKLIEPVTLEPGITYVITDRGRAELAASAEGAAK